MSEQQAETEATRVVARGLDIVLLAFFLGHAGYLLRSPLTYTPDDALFYYQIGFHASHGQGFRFNDLTATNGFHPLWLVVCTLLGAFCSTKMQLLMVGTSAVILLNGLTAFLLRRLLQRECGSAIGTAGTLMGVPYLFFVAHGMEGSLSACLFVALLSVAREFLESPKPTKFITSAALCGLVVAARLDLAFFVAPIALLLAWTLVRNAKLSAATFVSIGAGAVLGAAPVAIFLAINSIYFGDPRPISGILKFVASKGFGSLFALNGIVLAYVGLGILGMISGLLRKSAAALLFAAAMIGELLFVGYLLASNHAEVGSWYFMVFAMTGAIGFALTSDYVLSRWMTSPPWSSRSLVLVSMAATLASGFLMMRYGRRAVIPFDNFSNATSLGETARRAHIHRVFTFDRPGELAFLDGLSVVAADGLTTNLPFQKDYATRKFDAFLAENKIDAIVVPRLDGSYPPSMCEKTYLNAIWFGCTKKEVAGEIRIVEIEVFSRLTGASLGKLDMRSAQRLTFAPHRDLDMLALGKGAERQ